MSDYEGLLEVLEARLRYLEDQAGIPRPCPKCGGPVCLYGWPANSPKKLFIGCDFCDYTTEEKLQHWQDAWREHEANCRNADAYKQHCMEGRVGQRMKRECKTCLWWKAPFTWAERIREGKCACRKSRWYGCRSDEDDVCKYWEPKKEEDEG